ncbi:MAG: AAA family ATPase [Acidobacteria bacterium]|nr:AAA family ATPase [Acidobacteriota bacterium]
MSDVLWTPQQAAAVTEIQHTLLVANAGTGKTATVVGKIRWLLGLEIEHARDTAAALPPCANPCELREIAAITFTEKAAYDLKRKLREGIEDSSRADELRWEIDRASIGTIHSFCGELLREHALRLEIDPTFRVLDERESWAAQDDIILGVIKSALADGDTGAGRLLQTFKLTGFEFSNGVVDYVRHAMRDLRWHEARYTDWSDARGDLDEAALRCLAGEWDDDKDGPALANAAALIGLARRALAEWNDHLAAENARDFDALILDARDLLRGESAAAALAGIRRRYRILIIDEFQDTDAAQRDIAFAIAGIDGADAPVAQPQLFLVGDPKQSIYRFRGADISVWNEVAERLAGHGQVLDLSENFRCAPPIVDYVNDVCGSAMSAAGAVVADEGLSSRIAYADLEAGVPATDTAGLEWLVGEKRTEKKDGSVTIKPDLEAEAQQVAARIVELVGNEDIVDPSESRRPIESRDIAILYRSRRVLPAFERALSGLGIRYYISGAPHLGGRQEILDLLNVLRLLRNPRDDYRAFGFLRSPFVGLRDEVATQIALNQRGPSLLVKARRFLADGDWFDGPEGEAVTAIEKKSLSRALDGFAAARDLVHRVPLDEVLRFALDTLGYRLHLLVRGDAEEQLANIQTFLQFTEQYRDLDISTFLDVWERWDAQDNGLPQAPLYSKGDDVVTLSTVHAAKGLEWPVVFFVGTGDARSDRKANAFWSDPELGPLLCPAQADRGERTWKLWRREDAEDLAEDTRLLYVAVTRARDRLVLVGPRGRDKSYSAWLAEGIDDHGFRVRDEPPAVERRAGAPTPALAWLGRPEVQPPPPLLATLPAPPARFVVSATELMSQAKDPDTWRLRYHHGVQPKWEFAGRVPEGQEDDSGKGASQVPATVRGTVIHGVLERIREEAELRRILRETIGGLDDPDLEELLAEDEYTAALEEEIRSVIQSEEWAHYVEGEHYRELTFLQFAEPRSWRIGAFDLYRPGDPDQVIDFKTHEIEASETPRAARDYEIQARIYREAATIRGPARVLLHFTGPNEVVEMNQEENDG